MLDMIIKNGRIVNEDTSINADIAVKDGKIVGEGTPRELLTPEFIRKVYEVDAQVMLGNDGAIHILYHAQGKGFVTR